MYETPRASVSFARGFGGRIYSTRTRPLAEASRVSFAVPLAPREADVCNVVPNVIDGAAMSYPPLPLSGLTRRHSRVAAATPHLGHGLG